MTVLSAKSGIGVHVVEITVIFCGTDICVCICGGTHYHIGAGALGVPRPSLKYESKTSASTSVICVIGHKEDELAKEAATRLSAVFGCRVGVFAGLHIDYATEEDIRLLLKNYKQALDDVEMKIRQVMAI